MDTKIHICRFGIQGSGIKYNAHAYWKNWTGPISNWVCGYTPMLGMIVLDCIPEVSAGGISLTTIILVLSAGVTYDIQYWPQGKMVSSQSLALELIKCKPNLITDLHFLLFVKSHCLRNSIFLKNFRELLIVGFPKTLIITVLKLGFCS